ncbi:MAG: TerC family protein [Nanoarchaeota archaeon]
MVHVAGIPDFVLWISFIILILFFLLIDLFLFSKKAHKVSMKEALIWTGVWVSLALLFNLFVLLEFGSETALQFFTGYLLEKSLSVDNIFVIFLIFASFHIEPKFQQRILLWGIIGALVMRGIFIGIGAALISRFEWILYVFGAFLVYSGAMMFFKGEKDFDPHKSPVVRLVRRFVHVSREHSKGNFIVKHRGRFAGVTILFVALCVVEFSDIIFAVDSIPAIFGITTDPFIVFTSNIFAILGLRSLYFVVARAHDDFRYLGTGVAVVLLFIGLKMLLGHWFHISNILSLFVILGILALAIVASLLHKRPAKGSSSR